MNPGSRRFARLAQALGTLLVVLVAAAWAKGAVVVSLPGAPRTALILAAALVLFAAPALVGWASSSRRAKAVAMALASGSAMLSNDLHLGTSDTTPAAFFPFELLNHGTVYFDHYAPCSARNERNLHPAVEVLQTDFSLCS